MASLTTQQINHLNTLDHDTLVEIIRAITHENVLAYNVLLNGWLTDADEVLDCLAHEYNALAKEHEFYGYYDSRDLFRALLHDIAYPLAKQVARLPAQVENLAAKWLLDFDRLMEISKPSGDDDETYLSVLFSTWFQALTAQKNRLPEEISQAIFQLAQHSERFDIHLLSEGRDALSDDVLCALAPLFKEAGDLDKAIFLYLMLHNIDEALMLIQQQTRPDAENGVRLASLLLAESRRQEAIAILRLIEPHISAWSADFERWGEMLITALVAENEHEKARAVALDAFSYLARSIFWRLYLQAGGDETRDFPLFLARLEYASSEQACLFLSECGRYDLLDKVIRAVAPTELPVSQPYEFQDTLWRSLSAELYQQGYVQAAIALRRRMAEWAIDHGGREYYESAAVDVSAALGYCSETDLPELFRWLQSMYVTHRRKYTLWQTMRENVPGLLISKGVVGPVWQKQG